MPRSLSRLRLDTAAWVTVSDDTAEKRAAAIRLGIIVINIVVYYGFSDRSLGIPWLANLILLAALPYGLLVYFGQPYRRLSGLQAGILTASSDAVLITLFVLATGGLQSPFYLLWYVSMIAIAFRFNYYSTMLVGIIYVCLYVGLVLVIGQGHGQTGTLVVRASYILFAGALAGELSRQIYEQSQRKLALQVENETLIQVDNMRSQLISTASHELRTPLTSIRAYAELLADELTPEGGVRLEFAETINLEAERMTRLVAELLELGDLEKASRAIDLGEVRLHPVITGVASELQAGAEAKGLNLELQLQAPDVPVVGDAEALRQLLFNLVDNAIKFTKSGSITISTKAGAQTIMTAVTDTGIGIAQGDRVRIFDAFYQVGDQLTAKPAGLGLGLAICRKILQQHGSSLALTSTPGEGSTFSFELPLASTGESRHHPASDDPVTPPRA